MYRDMKAYAYARVSTPQQSLELQISEIKKYCEYRKIELVGIFQDVSSGKDIDRAEFKKMIELLQDNPLDVGAIVVWKLDRIGRSLRDLINVSDFLKRKELGLISITNSIDTTTKEGRLFFYMMGSIAEYERELIMERMEAGRIRSIADGKKMGRPTKKVNIAEAQRLISIGVSKSLVARQLKISRTTMLRLLKEKVEKTSQL